MKENLYIDIKFTFECFGDSYFTITVIIIIIIIIIITIIIIIIIIIIIVLLISLPKLPPPVALIWPSRLTGR